SCRSDLHRGPRSRPCAGAPGLASQAHLDLDAAREPQAVVSRRLRRTAQAAGIVVAAPIETSVIPIARRRESEIFPARSRPMPAPSAARVATTKPSSRGRRTNLLMMTSAVFRGEAKPAPLADGWSLA